MQFLHFALASAALAFPFHLCAQTAQDRAAQAAADAWPSKPVQVVFPFAPGGSSETEGRMYLQKMTESTGKTFITDFRPGAGGTIATSFVAKAPADGYTLMVAPTAIGINPAFYKSLPYDPVKDVAPVSLMSKRPSLLVVHPSLPIATPAEYIAWVRQNPGKLNYGTTGMGGSSHIAGAWLHSLTKSEVQFVHYKGTGPLVPDMLANRINATTNTALSLIPHVKAGKMRLIGVTTAQRSPTFPDVPSLSEAAPGYDYSSWFGITTTGGTPVPLLNRIRAELVKAGNAPDVHKKLTGEGIIMVMNTPAEFSQFLNAEMARWKKLVEETGMTAGDG